MLTATLLVVTAAGLRRIAAAIPVLASIGFLLSTRSDVEYFVVFIPLWMLWAATTDQKMVARSRPIRLPAAFRPVATSLPRRCVVVALALVPSAVLGILALAGAAPIVLHVPSAVSAGTRLSRLDVTVANRSSGRLHTSFSVGPRGHGHPWRAVTGPVVLSPGQRAAVVLAPDRRPAPVTGSWQVTVFTSRPPAFTSVPIRVRNAPAREEQVRAAPKCCRWPMPQWIAWG